MSLKHSGWTKTTLTLPMKMLQNGNEMNERKKNHVANILLPMTVINYSGILEI